MRTALALSLPFLGLVAGYQVGVRTAARRLRGGVASAKRSDSSSMSLGQLSSFSSQSPYGTIVNGVEDAEDVPEEAVSMKVRKMGGHVRARARHQRILHARLCLHRRAASVRS